MASVFITVYDSAAEVAMGDPAEFLVHTIDGAASAAIAGDGKKRKRVRLYADANCFFLASVAGTAPTNGTDSIPLGADNPEYFDIEVGYSIRAIAR